MRPEQQRVEQARQLQRLRQLREERALRLRAEAQRECDAAQAAVRQREAELAEQRQARSDLLHRAVHEAMHLTRLAPYLSARRDDLDDKLERAEYALIDDVEALEEASAGLHQASLRWRAARARDDAASDLLARARCDQRQAIEGRAEREDAPQALSAPATGAPT
jgi:hypothetical protein